MSEQNTPQEQQEENYESFFEEIENQENATAPEKEQEKNTNPTEQTPEQKRIEILEEQLDSTKEQMIRALADAENSRKRAIKDRQDASKFAVSGFARDLLSVADNLRRALESIPQESGNDLPQLKGLSEGIEATERELIRVFEKNGIKKLEPLDEKFSPHFHEVMFETPMPGKENSTIIQIIEPGYMLNDRILRPARVGIVKNADNADSATAPPASENHSIDTQA